MIMLVGCDQDKKVFDTSALDRMGEVYRDPSQMTEADLRMIRENQGPAPAQPTLAEIKAQFERDKAAGRPWQ